MPTIRFATESPEHLNACGSVQAEVDATYHDDIADATHTYREDPRAASPPKKTFAKSPYVSRAESSDDDEEWPSYSAKPVIYSSALLQLVPYVTETPKREPWLLDGVTLLEVGPDLEARRPTPPRPVRQRAGKAARREAWEVPSIFLVGKEPPRSKTANLAVARCLTRYLFHRLTGEHIDDFQEVQDSVSYQSYMIEITKLVIESWKCSTTEILLAVVYIDRIFAYLSSRIEFEGPNRSKGFITAAIKRMLTLGLFLSTKYFREYYTGGLKLSVELTCLTAKAFKELEIVALDILDWDLNVTTDQWTSWLLAFSTHHSIINDRLYDTFYRLLLGCWRDVERMFGRMSMFLLTPGFNPPPFDPRKDARFKARLLQGLNVPLMKSVPQKVFPIVQSANANELAAIPLTLSLSSRFLVFVFQRLVRAASHAPSFVGICASVSLRVALLRLRRRSS